MPTLIHKWDSVYATAKQVRETVQDLLVKTVIHTVKHGNVNVIKHAIDNLPEGLDKQAFADWIIAHAPVEVQYDSKAKEHNVTFVKRTEKENVDRLNAGKAKPWYRFAKKSGFKGFNLNEALDQVLAQANNAGKRRQKLVEAGMENVPEVIASQRKLAMIREIIAMSDDEAILSANESEAA